MKLVLDTNVLLSAILVPGTCRELLKGHALLHEWFTSPGLLTLKTHGGIRIRSPRQFMDAPQS